VKKYGHVGPCGRPKIVANSSKTFKSADFLPENDVINSKSILIVDDIDTLKNLYLSYKKNKLIIGKMFSIYQ
jgi:hypothetical protein